MVVVVKAEKPQPPLQESPSLVLMVSTVHLPLDSWSPCHDEYHVVFFWRKFSRSLYMQRVALLADRGSSPQSSLHAWRIALSRPSRSPQVLNGSRCMHSVPLLADGAFLHVQVPQRSTVRANRCALSRPNLSPSSPGAMVLCVGVGGCLARSCFFFLVAGRR